MNVIDLNNLMDAYCIDNNFIKITPKLSFLKKVFILYFKCKKFKYVDNKFKVHRKFKFNKIWYILATKDNDALSDVYVFNL